MQLTIAAALAVVAALAEFTIVPYLQIGNAVLQPVLVFGVLWAVIGRLEVGLVWAFVGGLALDILGQRPLGSSAFSLLIAIGVGTLLGATLARIRMVAPVAATLVAGLLYSMILLKVTSLLTGAPLSDSAIGAVPSSAIYGAVVAAVVGPLTVAILMRRRDTERADW
jgi:rod shape-determining protein MreD